MASSNLPARRSSSACRLNRSRSGGRSCFDDRGAPGACARPTWVSKSNSRPRPRLMTDMQRNVFECVDFSLLETCGRPLGGVGRPSPNHGCLGARARPPQTTPLTKRESAPFIVLSPCNVRSHSFTASRRRGRKRPSNTAAVVPAALIAPAFRAASSSLASRAAPAAVPPP